VSKSTISCPVVALRSRLKMKRLNSCCCCFSVRTGALIIAAFCLIGSLISIVRDSVDLSNGTSKLELQQWDAMVKEEMRKGDIPEEAYKLTHAFIEALISSLESILGANIAFGVFDLLTSFLVVVGVAHRKHSYLVPWLIFAVIYAIFVTVVFLCLVAIVSKWSGGFAFFFFVVSAIVVLLAAYFIWVVKSEYDNIKQEEESGKGVRIA